MNIVLANRDYEKHITDEGLQLQNGLGESGWHLVGPSYAPFDHQDVRTILRETRADAVFVQDKRDWDQKSGVCYAPKGTNFTHLYSLAKHSYPVVVPVKDAGPQGSAYHREFCEEVKAAAVVLYYHPLSCLKYCPWLTNYKRIRTYHSINLDDIPEFVPAEHRRDVIGTGMVMEEVYPIRYRVSHHPQDFGLIWLRHPGYGAGGCDTPSYLSVISNFKVHLATSSAYGFSLRKIIESVACGCTPVTDLPKYDVLPEIDRALVRVKPTISDADLKTVMKEAVLNWDEGGRRLWAQKAKDYYNYQAVGQRLSENLLKL